MSETKAELARAEKAPQPNLALIVKTLGDLSAPDEVRTYTLLPLERLLSPQELVVTLGRICRELEHGLVSDRVIRVLLKHSSLLGVELLDRMRPLGNAEQKPAIQELRLERQVLEVARAAEETPPNREYLEKMLADEAEALTIREKALDALLRVLGPTDLMHSLARVVSSIGRPGPLSYQMVDIIIRQFPPPSSALLGELVGVASAEQHVLIINELEGASDATAGAALAEAFLAAPSASLLLAMATLERCGFVPDHLQCFETALGRQDCAIAALDLLGQHGGPDQRETVEAFIEALPDFSKRKTRAAAKAALTAIKARLPSGRLSLSSDTGDGGLAVADGEGGLSTAERTSRGQG